MRDRIDKKGLIEGCLQKRREKKEERKKERRESLALLDFVKDLLDFCKTLCKI